MTLLQNINFSIPLRDPNLSKKNVAAHRVRNKSVHVAAVIAVVENMNGQDMSHQYPLSRAGDINKDLSF